MSFRPRINGEWIRWGLLVALVVATQFLDLRYVPKQAYADDKVEAKKNMEALKDAVSSMATTIALLQKSERVQDDHEQRIRNLENRKATYEKTTAGDLRADRRAFGDR
jgi:hypothetical protein